MKAEKTSSLERVAVVLEIISAAGNGLPLAEIATRAELPMPSVHRLISGMAEVGFVTGRKGRSHYRIGPRIRGFFQTGGGRVSFEIAARRELQRAANRFGEVIYIAKICEKKIELVLTVPPDDPTRTLVFPGTDFPFHATSTGKALVAFQSESLIARLLSEPLEKFRPNTIVDRRQILNSLARVRELGYAINDDEYDSGVLSISCPVSASGEKVQYAVGVVALKERFLMRYEPDWVAQGLLEVAEILSSLLPQSADAIAIQEK